MQDRYDDSRLAQEIYELMRYAANRSIGAGKDTLDNLNEALVEYNNASDEAKPNLYGKLLTQYASLVKETLPVTGRSLIETAQSRPILFRLLMITILILILAAANEGSAVWFANLPVPEEGSGLFLFQFRNSFLEFLSPFIWGALGACVYMMKRLYDFATDQQFDRAKLQGWSLRILLGAILGAVTALIYDTSLLGGDAANLDSDALAFFAGLGVKVFYGAFERTIEILSEKLNLSAVRRTAKSTSDARSALAQKLTETDKEREPEKYEAIVGLIEQLEREARQR